MSDFTDRLWDRLCAFREQFYLLLVVDVLLLVVSVATVPFVDLDSAAGVLVVLDVAMFSLVLVPLGYVQYRCRQRREVVEGY